MKFRCERDVLAEALATAGRAASSRSTSLPVLSGLHLKLTADRLTITGTDLDLTISVERTVAGDVDGVAVVPARLASDIVRALPAGAVTFHVTGEEARIAGERTDFSVRTLSAADWPRLTEPVAGSVTLPAATFGEALRQVVRAASTDDARPILTGVLLSSEDSGLRLVATDSYRLAVRDLPGAEVLGSGQKVLVPSKALQELARVLSGASELSLRLGERDATFEVGGVHLTTRLLEGEFPNYRQLIPQAYPNKLFVGREALLDAIRRVKLLAQSQTPIRLEMSADELRLTAVTQDVGQAAEVIDARYDGAPMTVAFNPDYLSAGVDAISGDEIQLETLDGLKPAVVRPTTPDSGYLYLLMPVRVP